MGRPPRPTGDDFIYHAINRRNNRADVLGPDGERDMFLGDLARTKARYPFALFGYCLMSNHFHLLLKPARGQSISRILQSLTVAHTWRHHRRQGTRGTIRCQFIIIRGQFGVSSSLFAKRCSDTGIPSRKDALTPEFPGI